MSAQHAVRRSRKRYPVARNDDRFSVADERWAAFYRYLYSLCADRFSPSDELTQFALSVANHDEMIALIELVEHSRERLKVETDETIELNEIATAAKPDANSREATRLRDAFFRLTRRHDTVLPFINTVIHDKIRAAESAGPGELPEIAHQMANLFSLDESETRIVVAMYAVENRESLIGVIQNAPEWLALSVVAAAAAVDTREFVEKTAPGSRLVQLGLIVYRGSRDKLLDMSLSSPVLFSFRSDTLDDLRAGLFTATPDPRHALDDFPISAAEIRNCIASIAAGRPVLISGSPGVGKTEFVRSLAASIGRTAHTLAATDERLSERGRYTESTSRVGAVRMAGNLLNATNDLLIVDESDTILQSATGILGVFGLRTGNYDKAELNDLLESLPVPSVWITNQHGMVPDSTLRRFGHIVEFPRANLDVRARMLAEKLGPPACSTEWVHDLAARYELTPAAIERTARIIAAEIEIKTLAARDVEQRVSEYLHQISKGTVSRDVRRLPTVDSTFDPSFCCTSEPLDHVEKLARYRVQTARSLRLLLGGVPGSGKTQYALWLARRIGRDVVLKRPSDLLSKYVGESETLIAEAFRTAERTGSVLVIDEADALLYNRDTAVRSWEQSQIAEFLQQIQDFDGILIACTNRADAIDPALRRRFHKHVGFGPIATRATLRAALAHVFPDVAFTDHDVDALSRGPAIVMSDLATAAETVMIETGEDDAVSPVPAVVPVSPSTVVREILANAEARDSTRKIGFQE